METATHQRRWIRRLLIAGVGGGLLWGCTPTPAPDPPEEEPVPGGTFRLAQDSPGTLDPARLDDSYEAILVNQIFDGLVAFDPNLGTVPCLAKSWEISRDGRVYTFNLRDNVRFHDGSPLTANDVVFSLSRVFHLDPVETGLAREYLARIEGSTAYAANEADHVKGLEAVSPLRVKITLAQPYASFLAVLASEMARVVPKAYVERVGAEAFGREPVGSGPFQLVEWRPEEILLAAFEEYPLGRAHLDSLVFEIPRGNHRDMVADRFLAKELGAVEVPFNRLRDFQSRSDISIHTRQELSLSYIALNLERAPFDDVRVRRAFAMSIDLTALTAIQDAPRFVPAGILPPGIPGFAPEPKLLPFAPDRARELLAEAGYPAGLGLPVLSHIAAKSSEAEKILHTEIRDQLARVGFQLETRYLDWLEFDAEIRQDDFHAYSLTWVADIPDPDSFLYPLFHSEGSTNLNHYRNSNVDGLLEQARTARSNGARWNMVRTAEKQILQDVSAVPLYHSVATIAVHDEVRGFSVSPLGLATVHLEDVSFARARDDSAPAEVAR